MVVPFRISLSLGIEGGCVGNNEEGVQQ